MSARLRDLGSMLKVGVIGFGGGSALIPVFDDELVARRRVLDAATFTRHTVVASITPGALPVKLGGLAGWHLSGAWLSLAMAALVALPGTALTVGLLAAVEVGGAGTVRYVEFASVGITVFIVALLLHYVAKVVSAEGSDRRVAGGIVVIAFVLTGGPATGAVLAALVGRRWEPELPTLGAVELVGAALAVIGLRVLLRARRTPPPPPPAAAAPAPPAADDGSRPRGGLRRAVALHAVAAVAALAGVVVLLEADLRLLGLVALSTVTSFGGGEAYVGVADGFFVQGGHVDSAAFYTQLVPIANALPGPILVKIAAGVGYTAVAGADGTATGLLVAGAAGVVAVTSCTAVALVVLGAYGRAQHSPVVRDIGLYILPVICGLLLTTSAAMLDASADVAVRHGAPPAPVLWLSLLAVVLVARLRASGRYHDVVLVAGCGAASTLALLAS